MKVVSNAGEVVAEIRRIRSAADAFTTNFFASADQLEAWLAKGALSWNCGPEAVLVFRRDRDFHHLYHAAANGAALADALRGLATQTRRTTLTADLVDGEDAVEALADLYARCGFRRHNALVRMVRLSAAPEGDEAADPEVVYADTGDAPAIVAFMERLLDRFTEQIPDLEEIRAEAVKQHVLIVRRGPELGGVLVLAPQGRTATLRYWWVNDRFRDQGIGARLIHSMFRLCRDARRIILWVIATNGNAIMRYEHYGFRRDGLLDVVMLKEVS